MSSQKKQQVPRQKGMSLKDYEAGKEVLKEVKGGKRRKEPRFIDLEGIIHPDVYEIHIGGFGPQDMASHKKPMDEVVYPYESIIFTNANDMDKGR